MNQKRMCALLFAVLTAALVSCSTDCPPPVSDTANITREEALAGGVTGSDLTQEETLPEAPTGESEMGDRFFPPVYQDAPSMKSLWAEDAEGNRLSVTLGVGTYTDTEGEVSPTEYNDRVVKLVIPAYLNGIKIVSVNENDFSANYPNLREVVLTPTLRRLPENAFGKEIKALTCSADLQLTDTLLWNVECLTLYAGQISEWQYAGMAHLNTLYIGGNVTSVGMYAFDGCRSLETLWVEGVSVIPRNAFSNCTELWSIVIGAGVEKLEDRAFFGCGQIASLFLGKDFQELTIDAFLRSGVSDIRVSDRNPYVTTRDIQLILWAK